MWVLSLGQDDILEKARMLAWKVPQTEEPGELQAMGLQRAGHDSATKADMHALETSLGNLRSPREGPLESQAPPMRPQFSI